MKKIEITFPIVGVIGLAAFMLQWENILAVCEALCFGGIVWLLFSKRIPLRTLPFIVTVIFLVALACGYGAIQIWTGWLWPPDNGCWSSVIRSPEGLPKIATNLIFRPHSLFWTIVDKLTGLCIAAILVPIFKRLTEECIAKTTIVMAVLSFVSTLLYGLNIEVWIGLEIWTVLEFVGIICISIGNVYCVTKILIDLFPDKKSNSFYIILLSVLAFSLLATLVIFVLPCNELRRISDIGDVVYWIIQFTIPFCCSLFYIVWYKYNKKKCSNIEA